MEGPFEYTWKKASAPDQRFALNGWSKDSDHESVVVRHLNGPRKGERQNARLEDVAPADPDAPNPLEAMKILRDFKRYELEHHVRDPKSSDDGLEELFFDIDWLGTPTCDGSGPKEKALYQRRFEYRWVAEEGRILGEIAEHRRDAKMCALAIANDIVGAYPHVPPLHRSDEHDKAYLAAMRAKRAAGEAEAAAKEKKGAEKRRDAKRQKP